MTKSRVGSSQSLGNYYDDDDRIQCAKSWFVHSSHTTPTIDAWIGLDWIGLDWIGLDWIGLDWIGLDWIGLDWIGLDWIGLDRVKESSALMIRWV
jgi:hypothetical protein